MLIIYAPPPTPLIPHLFLSLSPLPSPLSLQFLQIIGDKIAAALQLMALHSRGASETIDLQSQTATLQVQPPTPPSHTLTHPLRPLASSHHTYLP